MISGNDFAYGWQGGDQLVFFLLAKRLKNDVMLACLSFGVFPPLALFDNPTPLQPPMGVGGLGRESSFNKVGSFGSCRINKMIKK